jgi:hypothetical protein
VRTQVILNGGIESAAIITELLKIMDSKDLVLTYIDFGDRMDTAVAMFTNTYFRGQSNHILHVVQAEPSLLPAEKSTIELVHAFQIANRYNCERTYISFENSGSDHERYLRSYTNKLSGMMCEKYLIALFPLHKVQLLATHVQAELLDKLLRDELEAFLDC